MFTVDLKPLVAAACLGMLTAGCGSQTEALTGTWSVREVADDNYPSSDEGLLCDYTESGTLTLDSDGTGDLTLRYTTSCSDDAQAEWVYNWSVRMEETDDADRYILVLDGDEDNEELDCDLNGASNLDCDDEDGNSWRFTR